MLKIAERRKALGLSQYQLAEKIGIHQTTLANWETEFRFPNVKMLIKLSNALKCTIDDLIDKESHT